MNDKELADKIVVLGVGERHANKTDIWYEMPYYTDGEDHPIFPAEIFVRDPRVAMALIELHGGELSMVQMANGLWRVGFPDEFYTGLEHMVENESLPRAITESCVEALS